MASKSLGLSDLSITVQQDKSINLDQSIANNACSGTIDEAATGAAPGSITVVYHVRGADGWSFDGEANPAADEGRYRICNNTGASANPPNLSFSFLTIAP